MDDCTDMTISEAHKQNVHFSSSPPHFASTIELSFHKNPFDRQFELARKNNINPLRYAPSIPNLSQTSPLNTPSISLNDGAYISANVQDLIGPSPIIPTPSVNPIALAETPRSSEESSSKLGPSQSHHGNHGHHPLVGSQRSNVVSVICTPVPTSKSSELTGESPPVKSAPVIVESGSGNDAAGKAQSERIDPKPVPPSAIEPPSRPASKIKPLKPISFLAALPHPEPTLPLPIQVDGTGPLASTTSAPAKETISALIKIVPKLLDKHAAKTSTDKLLNISSLPSKKKEKSEEELLNKLKATEAALPPKAKPGRKSRSATAEDVKDKKKRSLERNRAAAMRCRLKKKKEVDELKTKVEKYEQQNKELRRIIEGLYDEVRKLKSELLRHKDC